MPTAAVTTAALLALAGLDDRDARDLMFSVGNGIAVCAFIGALVFFSWIHNRSKRK